jgi:hypothetical protein
MYRSNRLCASQGLCGLFARFGPIETEPTPNAPVKTNDPVNLYYRHNPGFVNYRHNFSIAVGGGFDRNQAGKGCECLGMDSPNVNWHVNLPQGRDNERSCRGTCRRVIPDQFRW